MKAVEVNFDGLVGPTHSYAGLSFGNIASMSHRAVVSNPRQAVLQGLDKAKALADLGYAQGLLPPQERPDIAALRKIGFSGKDADVLKAAALAAPELLSACSSASSMWTANAATVSPSCDSSDGRVHFTPANLVDKFHRAIEAPTASRILRATFRGDAHFLHHDPLPATPAFGDEGAANHTRFCTDYGDPGLQLFVYGRAALNLNEKTPSRFPARQTLEASQAIARLHALDSRQVVFAQQAPACIDAGAFHNDVVSVGNRNVFFYHERAFMDSDALVHELRMKSQAMGLKELRAIRVRESEIPLADAVKSYLFNSQLISKVGASSGERMTLVAPEECRKTSSVVGYLERMIADANGFIDEVKYFDLRQSMQNGGGPACLRLRVVLTKAELAATNAGSLLTPALFLQLRAWALKYYRDRLEAADLADPALLFESRAALDELTQIMGLGSIYPFQI